MTPETAPGSRRVAIGALTLACMAWGVSFVFIKDSDTILEPALGGTVWTASCWIVTVRFLLAGALLLLWPGVLRGLTRPVMRDALWLAIPSAIGYVLQAAGMRGLDAGTSAFLTSLYTPFTPLLAWLLFRRMPRGRILAAVVVALGGVAVLTGPSGLGFGLHELLVVLAAVAWAVQILVIDRFAPRHAAGPYAAGFFLWTGLIAFAGLVALRGDATTDALIGALFRADLQVPIWGLAVVSTLFTLLVIVRYQPRLDPSRAALLYVLEPAFAAMFAMVLHDESFGGYKLMGCLMLLGANVLVEARSRSRPRAR